MTVLIAEDDALTREGLAEILTEEGYEVIQAKDGAHALRLFRETTPDFACLDIMMPRLSGYDVCREMRREDPHIPVIFISAKAEEVDRVIGLELGADDYIGKPFGVREVVARIRAVTRRCLRRDEPRNGADAFTFGPYSVSRRELRAVSETDCVELSLREVEILHCLSQHPGQPVSRWELYRVCWREEMPPESRTLDQHISKLRKRLEAQPARPALIQTVHGYGYRYGG